MITQLLYQRTGDGSSAHILESSPLFGVSFFEAIISLGKAGGALLGVAAHCCDLNGESVTQFSQLAGSWSKHVIRPALLGAFFMIIWVLYCHYYQSALELWISAGGVSGPTFSPLFHSTQI